MVAEDVAKFSFLKKVSTRSFLQNKKLRALFKSLMRVEDLTVRSKHLHYKNIISMKNNYMKKIYSFAFGLLMLAGFVVSAPVAHAAFNDGSLGSDCPTLTVGHALSDGCAGLSTTATPGSTVNVVFYIHNTNVNSADNVVLRLSPQSASSTTSQTFSGSITSSNAGSTSGSASVTISSPASLSFNSAQWYTDKNSYTTPLPNGQTGSEIFGSGLNLGSIPGYGTCAYVGGVRDVFCHQGWLLVSFNVSGTTSALCKINSFTSSAGTGTIPSGSSATLSWDAPNCNQFLLSGGIFNTTPAGSGVSTGALFQTTPYTLTAIGSNGMRDTAVTTVNVGTVSTACYINNFSTSTPTVTTGGYATLNWNSNCATVTITGPNAPATSNPNGPITVGPLYSATNTYSIVGYSTSGLSTTATPVTVYVNTIANNCTANLSANQTWVSSGMSTALTWTSSGCTYVTVSGPNGTLSSGAMYGTVQTPAIYGPTVFNLVAGGTNTVNQSVTVSVNNNQTGTTPVVSTYAATGAVGTTATLNGYISTNNSCGWPYYLCGSSYTNYYFQYGTSQYALTMQTPTQSFTQNSGSVSAYVTNLQPNTTYYFQLIGSNSNGLGYGGILSFNTYGNAYVPITAITSVATNVVSSSARLNGVVTAPQGATNVTAHFEYGISTMLALRTNDQIVSGNGATNYFDTVNTLPNTTYYYRIVGISGGQAYYGATVSFTTPAADTGTVVVTHVTSGTGNGSAYVSLSITDQSQNVYPGDTINYLVSYQNISKVTLSNAVLNVILPTGVTFRQSSQGVLTTNNTVAVTLGTLIPAQQGTVSITAVADQGIAAGNNFVTTATLAFTTPSTAQDSAIAYVLNNTGSQNSLAGLALFGTGFFPNSFFGWIILLLLVLILALIARYFYHRANESKAAVQQPTYNNGGHGSYPNNNLPH